MKKINSRLSVQIFILIFAFFAFTNNSICYENNGTSVYRCTDGCTIHIVIQIGVNGTDADVASLTSILESCWEGKDCYIKCLSGDITKKCKVTVDVVVVKWSSLSDDDKKKFHQVNMSDGSQPSSAYIGTPNGANGSATLRRNGAYVNEYCHEVGHFGGLKDSYCGNQGANYATPFTDASCAPGTPNPCDCVPPADGRCTKPCDGYANDLMNSLQNVTCTEILGIVAAAGMNSCPENPCCLLSKTIYQPDTYEPGYDGKPVTTNPWFRWTPTAHPISYEMEIFRSDGSQIWGHTVLGPAPAPEVRIPLGILDYNERYSWHVRAIYPEWYYPEINGPWSEISYFTPVNTYFVNGPFGNDMWDGLTPMPTPDGLHGPKKTINGALEVPASEKYKVMVLTGMYNENVQINSPVSLEGEGIVEIIAHSPAITSFSNQQVTISNINIIAPLGSQFAQITGLGNVVCTNCNFYNESGLVTVCSDVYAKTLDGRMPGFGPGKLFFNVPRCAPEDTYLDLWLDPTGLDYDPGEKLSLWKDNTKINPLSYIPDFENAVMSDEKKQPSYYTDILGRFPGVRFVTDYGESKYGYSDIMEIPYSKYISSENSDQWKPDKQDKSLFIVFKTGDYIDPAGGVDPVYYSNGRQTIFESGGPLTGFNLYIINGKICFGMWNRFERRYTVYDPPYPSEFYPLNPDQIYMAHLEYNSEAGHEKFRAIISNSTETVASPELLNFKGVTKDGEDKSAVGGAARTSYHDYNTGETYSDHFGGVIGDVLIYNKFFDPLNSQKVYAFLNDRYGKTWTYPDIGTPKQSGWKIYESTEFIETNISSAFPNPFTDVSSFGVNIERESNVIIELFDVFGRRAETIFKGELKPGIHDFNIHAKNYPNGLYLYKVSINGVMKSGSVILLR